MIRHAPHADQSNGGVRTAVEKKKERERQRAGGSVDVEKIGWIRWGLVMESFEGEKKFVFWIWLGASGLTEGQGLCDKWLLERMQAHKFWTSWSLWRVFCWQLCRPKFLNLQLQPSQQGGGLLPAQAFMSLPKDFLKLNNLADAKTRTNLGKHSKKIVLSGRILQFLQVYVWKKCFLGEVKWKS